MQRGKMNGLQTALLLAISLMLCGSGELLAQKADAVATGPVHSVQNPQELVQWMTYYYMHPQPDLLVPALLYADKEGLSKKGEAPLTAFLSRVFAQNPKKINGWCTQLGPALSKESQLMLMSALWWSDTKEGRDGLALVLQNMPEKSQEYLKGQMGKSAEPIEAREIKSPEVLDELWGAFSATGDDKYVTRLMSVLPWTYDPAGDFSKMQIGGAARWSLLSNMQQHPKVKALVMKSRETHPEWRKALDQVIADNSAKTSGGKQAATPTAQR